MNNVYIVVIFASKYTLLLMPIEENLFVLVDSLFSLY